MGAGSSIEWTDHTFNPWWGCQKVSPGCQHCYAETLATRFATNIWGPPHATDRRLFGDAHWREPLKWNRQAEKAGTPARVFCSSMADVFEAHPQVVEARERLWSLIDETPWLTWLLLTKRPVAVFAMTPDRWWRDGWPANVWLGTSVEDQQRADARIPELLQIPAARRFLSCEPLLGPVDLCRCHLLPHRDCWVGGGLHWVIVGGESGPGARPMHPQWARDLRDQCTDAGVPFLFKQHGAWIEVDGSEHPDGCFPVLDEATGQRALMRNVGKKAAGRELDGRTWDEFPTTVEVSA